MKIKFLQDYRGVLSSERFFPEGTVIDLEDQVNEGIDGKALIEAGRAKNGGSMPKPKDTKGTKKAAPKKD